MVRKMVRLWFLALECGFPALYILYGDDPPGHHHHHYQSITVITNIPSSYRWTRSLSRTLCIFSIVYNSSYTHTIYPERTSFATFTVVHLIHETIWLQLISSDFDHVWSLQCSCMLRGVPHKELQAEQWNPWVISKHSKAEMIVTGVMTSDGLRNVKPPV